MSSKMNIKQVYDRIRKAYGVTRKGEIAEILGYTRQGLAYAQHHPDALRARILDTALRDGKDAAWILGERAGRPGGGSSFELELMLEVIEAVERIFQREDWQLPPAKKRELIHLIYEEVLEQEVVDSAELEGKVVRLFRFAA